jgi:hypothetical protein
MTSENEKKKPAFYDVDHYRKRVLQPSKPRGRLSRAFGRVTRRLDNFQGFFIPLLFIGISLGSVVAVVTTLQYGPWAFLLFFGCLIGGLGLFAEKKLGASIQVGDYNVLKRGIAQFLAFLVFFGILFLLLFLAGIHPL